jgi:hypothetical protein
MKQNKNIEPFNNLLAALFTKEVKDFSSSVILDKEAELAFQKKYDGRLSEDKTNILLSSLVQSLSKDTLGSLVKKALAEKNISVEAIQHTTGLSSSLLEDIKSDMVFTNSIPVKSLGRLLRFLNVSFERAHAAINATFEKLNTENKLFLAVPSKIEPAFKKGTFHNPSGFDVVRLKSDEGYLYQNKEALDKYTKRLGELYEQL